MSGTTSSRLMGAIVAQRRAYATAASATTGSGSVASISILPAQHRQLPSYRCLSTLILDNHDHARALSQRRVGVLHTFSSSSWELLLSSAVAAFLSGVALYQATNTTMSINSNTTAIFSSTSSNHQHPGFGFSASWGGGSGGNSMPPSSQPPLVLGTTLRKQQKPGEETEQEPGVSSASASFDVRTQKKTGA